MNDILGSIAGYLAEPPPPDESLQPNLYASLGVTYVIMVVAVALRVLSRRMMGASLWVDDYLIFIALIASTGLTVTGFYGVSIGMGEHATIDTFQHIQTIMKTFWAVELLISPPVLFSKLSVLALYWRLFSQSRYMRIGIYILSATSIMWGLGTFLATAAQCVPANSFWNGQLDKCLDIFILLMSSTAIDFATGIALLVLPIPVIWGLNTPVSTRIALIINFALGAFVCVWPMYRVIRLSPGPEVLLSFDITWNIADLLIWAYVEANIAVTSACIPCMRPILTMIQSRSLRMPSPSPPSGKATLSGSTPSSYNRGVSRPPPMKGLMKPLPEFPQGVLPYSFGVRLEEMRRQPTGDDSSTLWSENLGCGVSTYIDSEQRSKPKDSRGITVKREVIVD